MGKLAKRFQKLLTNDKKRLDVQHSVLFALLCVVASVMTVINILTHKGALTWVTGAFAVRCLVNLLLHRRGGAFHSVAVALFFLEVFAMFTFFLITGNPDGEKIRFRICIGLAYGEEYKPFNIDCLMLEADKNLYKAKTTGKDKFVV